MRIGIGITVHNRHITAAHSIEQIKKYAPQNAQIVIVDDASGTPFKDADYRFEHNAGIARAKNKCLELLDNCDYIFLFDDDCYPVKEGWTEAYISTGANHLMFTYSHLHNGRTNGNKQSSPVGELLSYVNPCGCMLFFTKKCLDTVGGFDVAYGRYGSEHADLSIRIHNAGLTPAKFCDIPDSLQYFYSADYFMNVESSVPNRKRWIEENKPRLAALGNSAAYKPYKGADNVVLTSYFTHTTDSQRNKTWQPDITAILPLTESVKKHGWRTILFHNCFSKETISQYASPSLLFIEVEKSADRNPYDYRWLVYLNYLKKNRHDAVFCTDATDVLMLRAPHPLPEKIYIGDEYDNQFNNEWLRKTVQPHLKICDYQSVVNDNAHCTLLNAGIVGAQYAKLVEFLVCVQQFMKPEPVHLTDMGVINYVARTAFASDLVNGTIVNTRFKYNEKNKISWFKHK